MKLFHQSPGVKILHADCLEMLRKLPDNSIDSVITDPPYGLSNTTPAHVLEAMTAWVTGDREFIPATSGGFMGKSWDNFVPPPAVWDEALRVLKPGGHLLCFAGTRTMGLMEMSMRLAGFDVRDSIAWLSGQGFPNGMDIGKVIDKAAGDERHIVSEGTPVKRIIPGADQDKTGSWIKDNGRTFTPTVTEAASEESRKWTGWNNALKPAFEPIIMARKPFKGPLFKNVLKHGTGALNVDTTRITGEPVPINRLEKWSGFGEEKRPAYEQTMNTAGRYPANVILDESQAAALDEQTDSLKAGGAIAIGSKGAGVRNNAVYGVDDSDRGEWQPYGDAGGASRFFYCAKAGKSERPVVDGKGHSTVKPLSLMRYLVKLVTPPNGLILEPFAGSGTTVEAALLEGFRIIASEREEEYLPLIVQRIERVPS